MKIAPREIPTEDWRLDGAGFEKVEDPARRLFAPPEPWQSLQAAGGDAEELLDVVLDLQHDVPIAGGETLRVRELFTLRSWLRWPKRAVLFLGGTALPAKLWDIPLEGYSGPRAAAQRGLLSFTVDYLGVGDHYRPGGDALDSTFERNLEALQTVVRYIRYFRAVPAVDLVGESWGGVHATQLAADARIRSVVMASVTYKTLSNPQFVSPEFVGFLRSLEHNYLPADPALLEPVMVGAPDAVKAHVRETVTGLPLLTTQLWQMIDGLPHFDPSVAKAPGLVISGSAESADGRALAADYGSDGAEFFEITDAGHSPRLESLRNAQAFWTRVFQFIESRVECGNP